MSKYKLSNGIKASGAYFIASVFSAGIAYITTPLYTRLLTTEEYGKVAVFLTWLQVFSIIGTFCLERGVFNSGMIDYPNDRDEYTLSMLSLSNIIAISFSVILLVLFPQIKKICQIDIEMLLLICAVFFFQPAYNFWLSRNRFELKYKSVLFWAIAIALITTIVTIVWLFQSQEGERLYPRLFGMVLSQVAIYSGFYIYIWFKGKCNVKTKYWKAALRFNLPLIPHYLSTYLLGSVDKLMISIIVSDTATAYYSVAHSVAAVASIVWTAINGSLVPYTYEKCKDNDFKSINSVTLPILTFFAVCCVSVIMLAPEVVAIMATKDYMEAIYVIPPIIGGVFFQVQYFLYANVVYYYKKPIYVMIGSLTAFVTNIVLNYIFINRYGYLAAGYTTLICFIIQALIDYCAMKKVVRKNIYNMKYILVLSVAVIIISILSVSLYNQAAWIRYIIFGVIWLAIMIERKRIMAFWNSLRNK